jgi:hypothetical protein
LGRLDELRAVTELNGRCFIYGGRQLGKTALLREAERRFHNPSRHRFARWIDLKAEEIGYSREPEDVWVVLYRVFRDQKLLPADLSEPTPRIRGRVDSFLDWLRNWFVSHPEGRWLILLDEADRFLEQDARREFPVTTRLKNLMEATERRFKVVFAGLHNVLRTTEQANHPLAHLGDPVEIGPLLKSGEWREAQALITQPFGHAGFVFEPTDLPVRILAQTNYYPSLIQLYCSQLLKQIQNLQTSTVDFSTGPRYAITEREVDDVYRSRDLREAIRSRIQLTLQLDPRYELIAYTIAYGVLQRTVSLADGLESRAIRERALRWWPEGFKGTGDHEFLVILEEMTGLGVLRDCGNRRFSLRNANVALLMGTIEEVEMVLLRDREPPQEFEPAVFRARVVGSLDSLARSPLTASQEAQLSGPENGVSVILGTRLGGIDDVLPYLQARYLGEFTRVLGHPREGGTFKEILQESLERRSAFGTTLFVVPAGMPWDGGWLADAVQVTNQLRSEAKFARIIFLCDAVTFQNRFWEIRQAEDMGCRVMALRPWDDSFLRQWLEDNGLQSVPEARAAIKEATGNWPRILYEYGMASRADHRLEANPGEWLSGYLTEAIASELRRELGLDTGVCHAILGLLAELGEATTEELEEFAADENIDAEIVPTTLEWAERLHLAWRSGTEAWRLDPMIRRLFFRGAGLARWSSGRFQGRGHFVGRVADAVRAGRSIIVRVPDYPALEFEHALRHELDGWYWHALPLTADRLPLDALYQRFLPSVLPDQVRNAYALAQADSMRGTVIQLEGMTAAVWAVWRDFLLEYQNACRMIPGNDPRRVRRHCSGTDRRGKLSSRRSRSRPSTSGPVWANSISCPTLATGYSTVTWSVHGACCWQPRSHVSPSGMPRPPIVCSKRGQTRSWTRWRRCDRLPWSGVGSGLTRPVGSRAQRTRSTASRGFIRPTRQSTTSEVWSTSAFGARKRRYCSH